ncbi:MAG: MarR family transcriptional regulator [Gammaproteobacteria bacterium]|nr:MarR family transcriptional regulator [Gammaproteobacteria bacterium]
MRTVTIDVRSLEDNLADVVHAMETLEPSPPRFSFATHELFWRTLTGKRWELLRAMAGAGPMSQRELARRLDRDIKAVHDDVHALIKAGLIDRADDGGIVFPYDDVHVDFMMKAA